MGLEAGEERPEEAVAVAGRIMARRVMGKLAFCRLVDATGSVQVSAGAAAGCGRRGGHVCVEGEGGVLNSRSLAYAAGCHILQGRVSLLPLLYPTPGSTTSTTIK